MRALPEYLSNPNPEMYRTGNYVCLDFETHNFDKGSALNPDNHLVLACWYDSRDGEYHHCWGSEYEQQELLKAISEADFIVAHNAKFELHWLIRCGYDLTSKLVFDTFVAEWVIAGNRNWGLLPGLDRCLERYGLPKKDNLVSLLIKNGVSPAEIPRPWLLHYCKEDVRATNDLMQAQLKEMNGTRLLPVVHARCIVTPALVDIETRGLHLDKERVDSTYSRYLAEYTEVMKEMEELTGGINPRSPQQVATYVYGELGFKEKLNKKGKPIRNKPTKAFPDGVPKVDEATLLSLNPSTKKQKRFMELKKRQAVLSSALDKNLSMFKGAVEEKDSMIYGILNQASTGTHRLSSSGRRTYYQMFDTEKGCQFQNLPNKFKKLFSARKPGWLFAEADYSQLEYRMGGLVTGDKVIYYEVESKHDVHKYTASVMYNVPMTDVTYDMRRKSKPDTFKPVYGGTQGTKEQMKYYKAFQEKYCTMYRTQQDWCEMVANYKELETPWGMKYYWPNAKVDRTGYLNVKTQVFNYPIQAFATAEVVPIALAMFWHRIQGAEMFLINTVHDSIEVELPENEIELFASCVVQALTEDVSRYINTIYGMRIDIPIGVGMVIGEHWGEASVSLDTWRRVQKTVELPDFEYDDGEVTINVKLGDNFYES